MESSRVKVLVINPSLFTPYYDYHLCRALVEIGLSVTMVGRPLREYEQLGSEPFAFADLFYRKSSQREVGWRTSRLGQIRKGFEHAFGLRALQRLAVEQSADVAHFQWLMLPFLDRIALNRLRRRCGLVLTVHNADIATHSSTAIVGRLGSIVQSLGQKDAVLGFDRYVVHTAKTADSLIDLGIGPERIVHRQHPPLELDVQASLSKSPRAHEKHNILFFGAIKPYKGVDILIEAGIAMAATRRDFLITIAGRPFQSLDKLRARIVKAGAENVFRFDLEFLSDARLADYLTAASIVVFPYREIDGSGALSHAIRFEKPIVASRVGGFAEAPFDDHIDFVPPENPQALAARLEALLDDPRQLQKLKQRTRQLRDVLPSWKDYAVACRDIYREIAPTRQVRDETL
jgi:glycosyltransferase involved in cell wall biosynthesis